MLKADIKYQKNSLSYGENDVHRGTAAQGMHAGIYIEKDGKKYFFRCPDFQYGEEAVEIIKELLAGYYESLRGLCTTKCVNFDPTLPALEAQNAKIEEK